MVAKKLDIPVFLVNESTNVPNAGSTKDEYPVPYQGLDSFVSRDLKGAFDVYYSDVKAVSLEELPSEGRGLIVSVRIDSLGYETSKVTSSSGVTAATNYPAMQWALGIKGVEAEEYIFTFSGTSMGSQNFTSKRDVVPAFQQLLGDAVNDFLKLYVEKDVQSLVASADAGSGDMGEMTGEEVEAEE
jgi:hypothetical protein